MKKFIVYLMVIVLTVSLGFAVYYLVDNREVISISTASIYTDVGKDFSIDVKYENKKSFGTISVSSSDDSVVSVQEKSKEDTFTFTAESGGVARLVFTTSNENFRNLYCDVIVGDGTAESPYYIGSVEQLSAIGAGELHADGYYQGGAAFPVYNSNCCYKLINNIDVTTFNNHFWLPLRPFSGILDGSGYTINGVNIDKAGCARYLQESGSSLDVAPYFSNGVGLFSVINAEAKVYNIKLTNYEASGEYNYFGTVAGKNYGSVMRMEVKDAFLDVRKDSAGGESFIGGIVGLNESTEDSNKIRHFARVDRCSINMTAGINYNTENSEADYTKGVSGIVGGVVGHNKGATVIYCYATGKVNFASSDTLYGGVIGRNEYVTFSDQTGVDPSVDATIVYESKYAGGNVKDCYSSISTSQQANDTNSYAGVIAEVIDHKLDATSNKVVNNLMGLYYDKDRLNSEQEGITKDHNVGILNYMLDGTKRPLDDTKYIVMGNTSGDMKVKDSYLSSSKNTIVYNEEGDFSEVKVVDITWLFGSVWSIDTNVNGGYPALNYNLLDLGEDFDSNVYPTYGTVYSNVSMNDYEIAFKGYTKEDMITLAKGETETLVVNPRNVSVTWTSDDDTIATVDSNGKITAVDYGQTTITATTSLGKFVSITVFVSDTKYVITADSDKVVAYEGSDALNATVSPTKVGCEFWYKVADESIATIDDTGVIFGHKVGDTTITIYYGVKSSDTKYATATCNVKVTCDDYTVVLSKSALTLEKNSSTTLTATVTPNDSVSWYSLDTTIATVVSNGTNSVQITGVSTGTTIINAVVGSTTASCTVTVVDNIVAVTYTVQINPSSLSMVEGDVYPLSNHVTASDNSDASSMVLSWSSTNNNVVSVDSSGVLTAKTVGTAYITAALVIDPTVYARIPVTVTPKNVAPTITTLTVTLSETAFAMFVGDNHQLTASTSESGITYTWTSANNGVATVDSTGKVTAVAAGTVQITATINTANYQGTASCYVTVQEVPVTPPPQPVSTISLSKTSVSMFVNSSTTISVIVSNCTISSVVSNNTNLVTATLSGTVVTITSKGATGNSNVVVTTSDGKTATCKVVVSTFSISLGKAKSITNGDSTTITATTNPSGYTVSWANHNPSIVDMSINGNTITVTGLTTGTATITATCNGVTATTTVTVNPVTYTINMTSSVSVDESDSTTITVTISSNLSSGYVDTSLVSWDKSSSYYSASVSNSGGTYTVVITGTKAGTDTIGVTIGSYSKTCTVTVNAVWSQYIYTLKQLKAITQKMDTTYYLCADISVGSGWTPIGTKNNPFTGKLEGRVNPNTNNYYKITGLTTSGATYAGLFGYTKGATIKNIIFDGCSISGEYAGSAVGYVNGGTVTNITAKNTSVTATKYAGGIVGYVSSGTVSSSTVTSSSSKEIKLNASSSNYAVGGVVGYNAGTVNNTEVTGSITVNGSASDKAINIGGVVGYNSGSTKNSIIECSAVKVSSSAKGNLGGIAGYNSGLVQDCYVTSASITGNTSKADSYTGGIVGFDMGGATLTISQCGVTDITIKGYYVGGIVGSLSNTQSVTLKWKSNMYDKGYHKSRYLDSSSYTVNVRECAVEDSVTLQGIYVGGLAGTISNGVISDCYARAYLTGISGGKVKAGFAATIQSSNMNNLGGTGSAGIVIHCYSACTFASSNGSNYSITESGVHLYYGNNTMRSYGYVIDYLFDKDVDSNAKEPDFSGWTNNDSDKSTSDMKKSTTYTSFGFEGTYWNLVNGQYITLKNVSFPF